MATPREIAAEIRRALQPGGSAVQAAGAERFFREPIALHSGRTADLRRAMRRCRREILRERSFSDLVEIADDLYSDEIHPEKTAAVFLLEDLGEQCGDREFKLFETWLDHVTNWSDHDALVHCLISPMVAAKPERATSAFRWAKSLNRWHRRAACVALIRAAREKMLFPEITQLTHRLLADEDDMVQKGLGWLLRETAKHDAKRTVPFLMKIRDRAPRLVLRTACETLPVATRKKILERDRPQK